MTTLEQAAQLCESMGIEGFGTLAIACAIRSLPKRESLTDEQIDSIMQPLTQNTAYSWRAFARAIESAHGIKG